MLPWLLLSLAAVLLLGIFGFFAYLTVYSATILDE